MRAIVCAEFGPLDLLRAAEVPDPEPGQVLVDVAAAEQPASRPCPRKNA